MDLEVGAVILANGATPVIQHCRFENNVSPNAGGGIYINTSGVGFLDGELLYVTGRTKDLIITYGRNFYPHDIEWLAAEVHRPIGVLHVGCIPEVVPVFPTCLAIDAVHVTVCGRVVGR